MQTYKASDLDMSKSTPVISAAQKFILPITQLADAEPLVYPAGDKNAGQPITDWEGKPIGDTGLVFFNGKDNAYQAVKGNGSGVVIINEVSEAQAQKLKEKVSEYASCPENLTCKQIKEILQYAQSIGLVDMYNSDRSFVQNKMTPVGNAGANCYGLHKRDDRDICLAVKLEGAGQFIGPSATPQKFEKGAVIVKQGDDFRLVQDDIFERTYLQANGSPAQSANLPTAAKPVSRKHEMSKHASLKK